MLMFYVCIKKKFRKDFDLSLFVSNISSSSLNISPIISLFIVLMELMR